ncbi:pentapeptide repeat-containing protein [Thermostichus vulcanus]|uniref:Pentapeptide repeat-containing protein n=1 Tax=Thermostichus vulcanus str. 'Rupite' TaxID=2813851 RepID=A0ABT0C8Q1_THEVL|nr:pentapeptide repeat-containing protein [Thermostichus vulcanus]MCJ2541720.1 pentapeptide repeat-containing protein [Thermostichus vulcanus str. 'Rupite']
MLPEPNSVDPAALGDAYHPQELERKLRALESIPSFGEKGIKLLLRIVKTDPDWKVRARAYELLMAQGDPRVHLVPKPLRDLGDIENLIRLYSSGERDFRFADLSGMDLSKVCLEEANLSYACLKNTHLKADLLKRANLFGADLSRAKLTANSIYYINLRKVIISDSTQLGDAYTLLWQVFNTDVTGRDLTAIQVNEGFDLSGLNLSETNLRQRRLDGVNLAGTNLRNANLSETWLRKANLKDCILSGANLKRANLEFANLAGTDLTGAILWHANLKFAHISSTTKLDPKWKLVWELVNFGEMGRDLTGKDLSGANLKSAQLKSAVLRNANLRGALLSGADLTGADLRENNLRGADLSHAHLVGADLEGSVLRGANLHGARFDGANLKNADLSLEAYPGLSLKGATLPDGSTYSGNKPS